MSNIKVTYCYHRSDDNAISKIRYNTRVISKQKPNNVHVSPKQPLHACLETFNQNRTENYQNFEFVVNIL